MNGMKRSLGALALALLAWLPAASFAGVFVSINIAPPPLPVYAQPVCPGPDYIWTPGYWAYGDDGYYWVPGTWVLAPQPGYLWTPGYWGWGDGLYLWHAGYWGLHIGFYGGVNYGFGYFGSGYDGGRWGDDGHFAYNRAVTNVNVTNIHNVYNNTTVINNVTNNRVSYNGGTGGTRAQASPQELAAAHDSHVAATAAQMQHEHAASSNRALLASVNHGRPSIAATARPAAFSGPGVVRARAAGGPMPPAITHGPAHGPASGPAQGPAHGPAAARQPMAPHAGGGSMPSAGFAPHNAPGGAGPMRSEQGARPLTGTPHNAPMPHAQPQMPHAQPQMPYSPQPAQHAQPQFHPGAAGPQAYAPAPRAPAQVYGRPQAQGPMRGPEAPRVMPQQMPRPPAQAPHAAPQGGERRQEPPQEHR